MSCCKDVMKPIQVSSCCTPQDTAAHAAKAMRDSGCGCSPVVEDTENLKLIGVVTERDVCCGVVADDQRASEIRGFMSRGAAVERALATLRFFWTSPQGSEPNATGYRGFYYHFLDMRSGRRAWQCELSTVDTAFLLTGALTAGLYFAGDSPDEQEIGVLADALYRRADWQWAQDTGATVTHGWKPESGFLKYRWEGYDEALLLYMLGLGSPTYPLPESAYAAQVLGQIRR